MLTFKLKKEEDYKIVTLSGDFTKEDTPILEGQFQSLVENDERNIAINFSALKTIESSIIISLLKLKKHLHSSGGAIILVSLPTDLQFIMSTIKLGEGFQFRNNMNFSRKAGINTFDYAMQKLKEKIDDSIP